METERWGEGVNEGVGGGGFSKPSSGRHETNKVSRAAVTRIGEKFFEMNEPLTRPICYSTRRGSSVLKLFNESDFR